MKIVLIVTLYLVSHVALCQDDDTIQYHHGLPETVEDTAQEIPQSDFNPKDSRVEISVEQLPQDVVKTLDKGPQYKGWQDGIILFDKKTELYWLQLKNDNSVRSYGFDKKGNSVSVQEKDFQDNPK